MMGFLKFLVALNAQRKRGETEEIEEEDEAMGEFTDDGMLLHLRPNSCILTLSNSAAQCAFHTRATHRASPHCTHLCLRESLRHAPHRDRMG